MDVRKSSARHSTQHPVPWRSGILNRHSQYFEPWTPKFSAKVESLGDRHLRLPATSNPSKAHRSLASTALAESHACHVAHVRARAIKKDRRQPKFYQGRLSWLLTKHTDGHKYTFFPTFLEKSVRESIRPSCLGNMKLHSLHPYVFLSPKPQEALGTIARRKTTAG